MYTRQVSATVTTDSKGAGTGYTEFLEFGRVDTIRYVKNNFADGQTITVTNDDTGDTIWTESAVNASATRRPRGATHTTAGAAAVYAAAGEPVLDKIPICNTRIKIVVANGGDSKSGTFYFLID
jgi:hypothetical protein